MKGWWSRAAEQTAPEGLRDYQRDIREKLYALWERQARVMVQMPTGTGKTHLLASVVRDCVGEAAGCGWDVLVVAHRIELIEQIAETLHHYGIECGRMVKGRTPDCRARVVVASIQTLEPRLRQLNHVEPRLIVIDEAHHAQAATYRRLWEIWPKSRILGLTATPCRLSGEGFADLFDALLESWGVDRFMAEGWLCAYDYYSLRPDGEEQRLIHSLEKRGADGDFQVKEMREKLDVSPCLERLCRTVECFVPGKKGIVYAIDIAHAEHIAAFYTRRGIKAVAISSRTPVGQRREWIERFRQRQSDSDLSVLVSVDLFSEGFDCPDVEFIQLARPTLSLSKYLQMVGRGLRMSPGKRVCTILDNVGLYRLFGLPSAERDWTSYFEARPSADLPALAALRDRELERMVVDRRESEGQDLVSILSEEECRRRLDETCRYRMVDEGPGRIGVKAENGRTIVPCQYRYIRMTGDGLAFCVSSRKAERPWVDLQNGMWFRTRPHTFYYRGLGFSTEDGEMLYVRMRSDLLDERCGLHRKLLEVQVGTGVSWKKRYVPWSAGQVYELVEGSKDGFRVYRDAGGRLWAQQDLMHELKEMAGEEELQHFRRRCAEEADRWWTQAEKVWRRRASSPTDDETVAKGQVLERLEDDLIHVVTNTGTEYWVDTLTHCRHERKPVAWTRGFVKLLREGDMVFVRNIPEQRWRPWREWEVKADDYVCTIADRLYLRSEKNARGYLIKQRSEDFRYFVVQANRSDYLYQDVFDDWAIRNDTNGEPEIRICRGGTGTRASGRI